MNQDSQSSLFLPFFSPQTSGGHGSLIAANDHYAAETVDMDAYLNTQRPSTFTVRAYGKSMVNAGILDQALLVVNRDLEPRHDDIVIAEVDGEMSCKILDTRAQVLRTANMNHRPVSVRGADDKELDTNNSKRKQITILGVVTHAINPLSY